MECWFAPSSGSLISSRINSFILLHVHHLHHHLPFSRPSLFCDSASKSAALQLPAPNTVINATVSSFSAWMPPRSAPRITPLAMHCGAWVASSHAWVLPAALPFPGSQRSFWRCDLRASFFSCTSTFLLLRRLSLLLRCLVRCSKLKQLLRCHSWRFEDELRSQDPLYPSWSAMPPFFEPWRTAIIALRRSAMRGSSAVYFCHPSVPGLNAATNARRRTRPASSESIGISFSVKSSISETLRRFGPVGDAFLVGVMVLRLLSSAASRANVALVDRVSSAV